MDVFYLMASRCLSSFAVNVMVRIRASWYLLITVLYEVCSTEFNSNVFMIPCAIVLVLFAMLHAVGNLHALIGTGDINGYGYFYVRLLPTPSRRQPQHDPVSEYFFSGVPQEGIFALAWALAR